MYKAVNLASAIAVNCLFFNDAFDYSILLDNHEKLKVENNKMLPQTY